MGFASGLPLSLSDSTLQAWLTVENISIASIGMFSLVGFPYLFKFAWAPLLDWLNLGFLGRRKDWILFFNCALQQACYAWGRWILQRTSSILSEGNCLFNCFIFSKPGHCGGRVQSRRFNANERALRRRYFCYWLPNSYDCLWCRCAYCRANFWL